ncbi:MAG: IS1595 family transposase [Phycisphaerales bacterium]
MNRNRHLSKSPIVDQMPLACADERAAIEFFEAQRWGDTPACVHCGSVGVYTIKDRTTGERRADGRWRCRDCGKQFTVRVGNIMEDSPIPLRKWAYAFWCAATAKNGVSALEMSRKLQITYKSALFLMNRIRWAMRQEPGGPKLTGVIEADTTFVGGRPRFRRIGKPGPVTGKHKPAILAVVQRGGDVRTRVFARVNKHTLGNVLTEFADTRADLVTDDRGFGGVGKPFRSHRTIKHSLREYVSETDPTIHTNTVEGFFSRIKRGLVGVYHSVSREHLFRYADQYAFLYNARKLNDGERIGLLIRSAEGKRLMRRAG